MSDDAFIRLQERVFRAVEVLRNLQKQNASLKQEVEQLRRDLEELKKQSQFNSQMVERLQSDRLKIRARVERILKNVTALEEPSGESTLWAEKKNG
ncbi:MAG: cell division protein ZapB [Acidobacteria bacterium]|nr:cell division protein ZapB [Acidobacteriota bacterium]